MEHLAVEKEDRSLFSMERSGCLARMEGAEHLASDASPRGAADFQDIYHGACPKEQWGALEAGECGPSTSFPQSVAS